MPMYNLNLNWFHVTTTRGNLYSVTKCAFRTYSLYSSIHPVFIYYLSSIHPYNERTKILCEFPTYISWPCARRSFGRHIFFAVTPNVSSSVKTRRCSCRVHYFDGKYMKMRAFLITVGSIALTASVIANAYYQKQQFYPSVVYITKSNTSMAVRCQPGCLSAGQQLRIIHASLHMQTPGTHLL